MRKRGFTLVEILIVCTILATLAAFAIPNLLRARMNASEAAAMDAMRTLSTALEAYRAAQVPPAYPTVLSDLSSTNPPFVTPTLTGAISPATARQGYSYTYNRTSTNTYTLQATPQTVGFTGNRRFYVDESGIIRADANGPAGPNGPEIQ